MPAILTEPGLNSIEQATVLSRQLTAKDAGGIQCISNSYINLTTELAFGLSDFSFNFKLNLIDIPATHSPALTHSTGNRRFLITIGTAGELSYTWWDGAAVVTTNNTGYSFELNKVLDITITVDRNGDASAYVDGKLVNTTDVSGLSTIDIGLANGNTAQVAFSSVDTTDIQYYAFRAFDTLLTAAQVLDLHRCGIPFDLQGNTSVDLDLTRGKGFHYPDRSGNENHGTGVLNLENLVDNYTKRVDLAYSASLDVDFDDTPEEVLVGQLTGNLTLTGSNYHKNGETVWRFTADGSARTITRPAGWGDINNVGALVVAANKAAQMVILSSGTVEADCDFFFVAEP